MGFCFGRVGDFGGLGAVVAFVVSAEDDEVEGFVFLA